MRRAGLHGGVLLAALAIAFVAVACLPPKPAPTPPAPPAPPAPPSPGQLKLSPAALDYGTHPLANLMGANMPIITVTVTNTGGQTVNLVSETSSNGIFSMPANTCSSASLSPGQSCAINLQYCPNAPGTSTSTLTAAGTTGTLPVSATANVTGTAT
jgi:hypothetical protein